MTLHEELRAVLNRHSAENGSNTPDFILADYLLASLQAYDLAARARDGWYLGANRIHAIGAGPEGEHHDQ